MATLAKIERERLSERVVAGLRPVKEDIRRKGYHITKDGRKIRSLGRRPKKKDIERVLRTYKEMGSINKTAKLMPYSYGTVYKIIKEHLG